MFYKWVQSMFYKWVQSMFYKWVQSMFYKWVQSMFYKWVQSMFYKWVQSMFYKWVQSMFYKWVQSMFYKWVQSRFYKMSPVHVLQMSPVHVLQMSPVHVLQMSPVQVLQNESSPCFTNESSPGFTSPVQSMFYNMPLMKCSVKKRQAIRRWFVSIRHGRHVTDYYYTRCLSSCFRKVNLCSRFSLWSRIALVIFRNITYVALTNKMADTCVTLRQSRVQARPVRFGQDGCTMYTHCLCCMAWIALTNNMAEIFRQLCVSSRKHVKNL